jgi:hypothetical protein
MMCIAALPAIAFMMPDMKSTSRPTYDGNRASRRKQQQEARRKAKNDPIEVDISQLLAADNTMHLTPGDIFTVTGVRVTRAGRCIQNCKPGDETLFRAK